MRGGQLFGPRQEAARSAVVPVDELQRTAVQGGPRVLTAVTGRWVTGAPRVEQDVHPFRKSLQQLRIGDSVTAGPRLRLPVVM